MDEQMANKEDIEAARECLSDAFEDLDNFSKLVTLARQHPEANYLMQDFEKVVEKMEEHYTDKLKNASSLLKVLIS